MMGIFVAPLRSEPQNVKINIISSTLSEFIFEVEINNFLIKDTFAENSVYQVIRIFPEEGYTGEIGKPELPMITRLIAIPPQSGVFIDFEIIDQGIFEDILVFPNQIGIFGDSVYSFKIDSSFYAQNVWYPAERVKVGVPGILKDFRVVKVSIYPFSYNPLQKKLFIYKKLRIKIYFSGIDIRNSLSSLPQRINEEDISYYESLILNYDAFAPLEKSQFPYYLVITADMYYDALSPFVSWKRKIGYNVIVTKISEITNPQSPDTVDIKNYIKQQFNNLPGLSYVLLVGDGKASNPQIPLYYYDRPFYAYSDYYYSLIAGDDSFPDVCIGRFNVSDTKNLNVMINKCLKYQRDILPDWNAHKVFLVAGIQGKPQMDTIFRNEKNFIRRTYLQPHNIPYDTAYGVYQNFNIVNKIKNVVNNGVGLVNYRGHGGIDCWAKLQYDNPYFTTLDVRSLSNSDKFPIVLSIACLTGSIHKDQEAFIEAWTLHKNGGGVAALGATHETHPDVNNSFDKRIFETIYDFNEKIIGNVINIGKIYVTSNYREPGLENGFFNACVYVYDGDPSLNVWTDYPKTFTVIHPDSVLQGQNFIIKVRYGDSSVGCAKVCFYKEGVLEEIKVTNTQGEASFNVPVYLPSGKYNILVSKFKDNFKPYQSEIFVTSVPPDFWNLRVSEIGANFIKIAWDDLFENEQGFEIWRKKPEGLWGEWIREVGANVEEFVDNEVNFNVTYVYKIRAKIETGEYSNFSDTVAATPNILNPPFNLVANSTYPYNSITLTWQDNSNCEYGYEIWRKGADGIWRHIANFTNYSTQGHGKGQVTYSDNTVSRFQDYFYKVRAFKYDIPSQFSDSAWATTCPLISSGNVSLSPSSGKALIIYKNNKYHCVYTRNDTVYYAFSQGNGLTWASEFIDKGESPCLEYVGGKIWVFYVKKNSITTTINVCCKIRKHLAKIYNKLYRNKCFCNFIF